VLNDQSLSPLTSDEAVPFTGLYALVVDDNRVNQRVLSGLLSRLGIKVAVAGNGLVAVEMAAIFKYNVVFMDIDMPVMDGLTATGQMKRMADCPYIIECSANIGNDGAPSLMDASIAKPTLLENLRQVLEQYVAHSRGLSSDGLGGDLSLPGPSNSFTGLPLPGYVGAIEKSKQQDLKDGVSSVAHTHQHQAGTRSCLRIPCPRLCCGN
jgi:CheY-like chemotaxis protein